MLTRRHWLATVPAVAASQALVSIPLLGLHRSAAAAAPRVISVGGALTELIYAMGAQADLVGVDSTSLFPAEATRLPNVGYARTLAAEGLLSLAPTMIVATEEAGPPAVLNQLQSARIPLHVLRADHRFEGVVDRTRRLGELMDRPAQARALIDGLQQAWAQTQQTVSRVSAGHRPPRVLFVLSNAGNQARISGRATAADAMIRYAGAVNALGEVQGYQALSPEAAIAAAPDVILATSQGVEAVGGADALLRLPGLAQTPAARQRRVVSLETMEMLGFGPRLPQALAKLATALHAGAMG
ncbi:heme/hemin ABC transporter substrate-binding protein [Roseateles depolymerans]|uniref:ABC transporter substrate-binding protein n=1 Tax=Roseateles depolymerans TaxID=76731 RepID=A0A0U3LTR2_9BURK|nr:ABC transporter substrate-binding protein [Roseateles depolymerans]ALV08439.1 ABC transporter substrate-binding protein [Roseateles depolymerans]REG21336.1 iron complex transport system substrate-binding protein [Roseateles depolymerans]